MFESFIIWYSNILNVLGFDFAKAWIETRSGTIMVALVIIFGTFTFATCVYSGIRLLTKTNS